MEYNTSRELLPITEYGRHIKKMIDYAISIEDKEKRTVLAKAIVNVMGQLVPHLRDHNDLKNKLWDHLFILSDFKLDVDAPYPMPDRTKLEQKPEKISYPSYKIKFKHYGRNIESIIKKVIDMEEGPAKESAITAVANHLKKSYLSWNRESVNDEVIVEHLGILSDGKLKLDENVKLNSTRDILAISKRKPVQQNQNNQGNQNRNNQNQNRNRQNFSKNNNMRNKPKPSGQ